MFKKLKTLNTIYYKPCVKEAIAKNIFKIFQTEDNENTTFENLWDAAKTVLARSF